VRHFAPEIGGFAAETSGQIAHAAKKRVSAEAYAHRTACRMMLQK
jgi:hypothetical protein